MPYRKVSAHSADFRAVLLALSLGWPIGPGCHLVAGGVARMAPAVRLKAEPFTLQDVRLLESPLRHAMELDRKYLLSLEPDRLLHVFRIPAGLPSAAKPYGGWMAPSHNSRGEFVGHSVEPSAAAKTSLGFERRSLLPDNDL
jgi:hypothetical protein